MPFHRAFLFDIDGTLLRGAGPQHGEVLVEAIRQVVGVPASIAGIPVHGMLDQDILTEMLLRAGRSSADIASALPDILRRAQQSYPLCCPDLRGKVLPGVREVLDEISALGFPIGLVTGNLTAIGWCKVERAGLKSYFQFGAFAEMSTTRAGLAAIARKLSGADDDALITQTGDAPSDIIAARENRFRSVAVATGMTSLTDLAKLGPHLLLNDLSQPEDRFQLVHGGSGSMSPDELP